MTDQATLDPQAMLVGQRVLLVEDEMILALDLHDIVESFGCIPTNVSRISKALQLISAQAFDVAILDLNLAGEKVYPVADELGRRGIPFIFTTGYGEEGVLGPYRHNIILAKPYTRLEVQAALLKVLGAITP